MATIKHISSKNADYGAAEQYLAFQHDEFTMKPVLDKDGWLIPREDYRMETVNCGGEDFALSCLRANMKYKKNSQREDIKSHHYIISFDPRDAQDNGLTVDRAQELGLAYCKEHFPGHQAMVCTHPNGHNHSGNIHVHIVINSLRTADVERKPYMDRPCDAKAGMKHRCTAAALRYFRSEVMEMCHREGRYQIDLLNGGREIAGGMPQTMPIAAEVLPGQGKESVLGCLERKKQQIKAQEQGGVQRMVDIDRKMSEGKGAGYAHWAKKFNLQQMSQTMIFLEQYGFENPEEVEAALQEAMRSQPTGLQPICGKGF